MSLFEDLKPFLKFANIFGCAPYSINDVDISLSRIGVSYSGLCIIFHGYLLFRRFQIIASYYDTKLRFLTILRTTLTESVVLIDILVCVIWHRKFRAFVAFIQRYDHAVKFKPTPKTNIVRYWIVLIFITIYLLFLGWLTYIYENENPLENSLIYVAVYASTTFSILKFSAMVASVFHRFRHLNFILKCGLWSDQPVIGWSRRRINLRDAWCLHNCLVAAAEEINSLYNCQLLLWIAGLTFNIISRIYVFFETDGFNIFAKVLREGGIAMVFIFLLGTLTGVCHITASEANKVGSNAFSPRSNIFQRRNDFSNSEIDESIPIGLYFLLHRLNFSAAFGLIQVDLPLLQTIAGTMTTYLVILKAPG